MLSTNTRCMSCMEGKEDLIGVVAADKGGSGINCDRWSLLATKLTTLQSFRG